MLRVHLDTDLGGDMDDLCALAMLLKWPDLQITGITSTSDESGRRAGYIHYVLGLLDRTDIPVAAGADVSHGYYRVKPGYPPDEENWPVLVPPRPGLLSDALALLKRSVEQGAIVVGTGPYTNLRLLDEMYPGLLRHANLFLMGGYVFDIPDGYPPWGNEMDWNIQLDARSAHHVLEHASPTLVPLTVSVQTALRRAFLPGLAQTGRLGQLIVRQAELCARSYRNEQRYGEVCSGLPADIINFQHDALACAIALGWREGVKVKSVPLKLEMRDGWLYEIAAPGGVPTRLVTTIDGAVFDAYWYDLLVASGNIMSR